MKARHKWLLIFADIIHWELTCDPQELLSAECDRLIEKHPILARAIIYVVGAQVVLHLSNSIPNPPRYDVMSTDFHLWRRLRRP